MNAYDIVDKIINIEKKNHLSDNELHSFPDWKVILAILETKYNARYSEPYDTHVCGSWNFDNPNYIPVPGYKLSYCFLGAEYNKFEELMTESRQSLFPFAKEIIRLDARFGNLYWDARENTVKEIEFNHMVKVVADALAREPHVYVGKNRIWKIDEITLYSLPSC